MAVCEISCNCVFDLLGCKQVVLCIEVVENGKFHIYTSGVFGITYKEGGPQTI